MQIRTIITADNVVGRMWIFLVHSNTSASPAGDLDTSCCAVVLSKKDPGERVYSSRMRRAYTSQLRLTDKRACSPNAGAVRC